MSEAALLQGSDEWLSARAALVTGTGCSVLEGVNPYQTQEAWLRANVRALAGVESETVLNQAMQHGTATEPEAVAWYESRFSCRVRQTGLVRHPEFSFLGASPDGLVGLDGGIEIKCPFYAKRPYSVFDASKEMYLAQCRFVMECCDLEWIDFVCFLVNHGDPIVTVERVNREPGWLDEPVAGRLFPKARKGKHPRIDLFQAWHNHAHSEHQDPARCRRHLEPLQADAITVTDDEDLNRLDMLRGRVMRLENEIGPQIDELDQVKAEMDSLKKLLASRYENSVSNGSTLVQVIRKTPPIDYKKAFEFLGGEQAVIEKDGVLDSFRRATNTQQISIKSQGEK